MKIIIIKIVVVVVVIMVLIIIIMEIIKNKNKIYNNCDLDKCISYRL